MPIQHTISPVTKRPLAARRLPGLHDNSPGPWQYLDYELAEAGVNVIKCWQSDSHRALGLDARECREFMPMLDAEGLLRSVIINGIDERSFVVNNPQRLYDYGA